MQIFRIFFKQMSEGLKSIFKQGWMSFSAILTISVALLLASVLFVIVENVNAAAQTLEDNLQIVVRVEDGADRATIEAKIKEIPNVESVSFKTKDESLKEMEERFGNAESQIWKSYEGDNNPLKDLFLVKVKDKEQIEDTANKIGVSESERQELDLTGAKPDPTKYIEGVYDLNSGGSDTQKIVDIFASVRIVGIGVIGLVLFVAFILISNTIRMTIIARRSQIQIMRLVGASNSFIRLPFFFEGIFIGILGSIIPIAAVYFGYKQLNVTNKVITGIQLLPANQIIPQTTLAIIAISIAVGALASLLSISRYLRS